MTKKTAVMTIAIGDEYQVLAKLTHPIIKNYADRINSDFIPITESNISHSTPHWEKFIIYDLLNKYERIIYFDTDLIIRDDCPNLFEEVNHMDFGAFNEAPFTPGRQSALAQACQEYGIRIDKWKGTYWNTGVMVISRPHKEAFKKPEKESFNFFEQSYLNAKLNSSDFTTHDLHYYFNRLSCMDPLTGEQRHAAYIIHYAGAPNMQNVMETMRGDLRIWRDAAPDYNFQRHVIIDVQGGLGDQIDAEPTVQYLLKHIYPYEDVRLMTHFPRVFEHLDIPVAYHGQLDYSLDTQPYHIITLPGPDTLMWKYASNLLCHTVDFCSLAILRRTLPDADKTITLSCKESEIEEVKSVIGDNLQNMVLVHAGKHWPSKTFPKEWWQEIIDGIQEAGITICLIGKDDPDCTRGVIDLECREGMLDTRNLLSLGGLIALISQSKVLLSNDSSPIHIAGAFENWVVLIPTCKHPDHLLPYRHGTKAFRTSSLYKRLTLDSVSSAPSEIYTTTADEVVGDILDYLPEPQDVINAVIEAYQQMKEAENVSI
jgi:hypothetical protein